MLPECAAVMKALWDAAPEPTSPLVVVPRAKTFAKDLAKARVAPVDDRDRHADFHSFRYTFCKQLGLKLPIQLVKKLMRHLTLQKTADLYMDLEMDELGEEVWQLPALFSKPTAHAGRPKRESTAAQKVDQTEETAEEADPTAGPTAA